MHLWGTSEPIGTELRGFQEDDSPDRSPRSHCETFESEKSVHGTENEEATPRAESAPVPIPGVVEAEGPRRASAPLALARQASKQLTQDTSETVARLRIGTTMAAEQLESPPELKLAAAWRRKTSGTTSKVARTVSSKAHGHSLHDEEDENVFVRVLDRRREQAFKAIFAYFQAVFGRDPWVFHLFRGDVASREADDRMLH